MPYSSSLTDKEWVIIEPSHTKKKENLSHDRGVKDKYLMVSSSSSKMVVIGVIYPRIYLLTPQYFGIINSGENQE
jgi:hypothetical protein